MNYACIPLQQFWQLHNVLSSMIGVKKSRYLALNVSLSVFRQIHIDERPWHRVPEGV